MAKADGVLSETERQTIAAKLRRAQIDLLLIERERISAGELRSVIAQLERIIVRLTGGEPK